MDNLHADQLGTCLTGNAGVGTLTRPGLPRWQP
jgi:hypothetical protein